ncbi:hypothetical protein HanHA300_Chr15g0565061 [Helianthus annuus]|nr:hypothetical protein HanHA300_Chr15g0565061 [Helianthus annuus]KAJ0473083.1 hypothetical protein HanHA89_Chr15g0614341 [Helianthus annuus]KAJ0648686.1 hypothetical protein HanLR1_Chr15g0575711 [Helianthus annuus]
MIPALLYALIKEVNTTWLTDNPDSCISRKYRRASSSSPVSANPFIKEPNTTSFGLIPDLTIS